MLASARAISLDTIRTAARRIRPVAVRTPLVRLDPLARGGPEILLKVEVFQPIGSFKIRGAMNALAQLTADGRHQDVWTVSAGNAALGVALAAREHGLRASALVMDTAPAAKLSAIERLGATVVQAPYDQCWEAVETGRSDRMRGRFVHPFDDDDFISGNGTLGLEILDDVPDVDAVIAPVGGGGLLAGIGCAIRASRPDVRIYGAEPETAAPLAASLAVGRPIRFEGWTASFVDGAGGRSVLPSMWPLLREWADGSIVVSLEQVRAAMRRVAQATHLVLEGAAACAVAAATSPAVLSSGHRRIVAIASGGNIDLSRFAELIGACGQ